MYLLAEELLSNAQAAFIAGLIYMAWPFRLSQLDHPNLLATFWIPLFFLFLIRTLRRGRWQDALAAGVALALVGYTRWQLLVPVSFMTGIYLLGSMKQWLDYWKQTLPLLALAAGVAIDRPAAPGGDARQRANRILIWRRMSSTSKMSRACQLICWPISRPANAISS